MWRKKKRGWGLRVEGKLQKNVPKNDRNMLYLSFSKNMTKSDYKREGGRRAPQASLSQIGLKKGGT